MATTTTIQRCAWIYVILFIFIFMLGYVPQFTVGRGYLFGLYQIGFWDDLLHIVSALAAAVAAFLSLMTTVYFFRIVGMLYTLDAIVGFLFERGFLDLSIFLRASDGFSTPMRIAANAPHFIIGLIALYIGFILGKKYTTIAEGAELP